MEMKKRTLITIATVAALLGAGCTDGEAPYESSGDPLPDPPPMTDDAGTEPPPDPVTPPTTPTECVGGETYVYVLDQIDLGYATGEDETIVPGFDLDGQVSDGTDLASCRQADYTSPDGVPGIDNQLGPAIVQVPGINVSDELATDIARGALLLLVRLRHVDDLVNDDCVEADVLFAEMPEGMAAPEMADGERFMPGQTFDVAGETVFADGAPRFTFEGATITAGHLEAATETSVPFQIPTPDGTLVELTLNHPKVAADVDDSGVYNGVLGGRLDKADTINALSFAADPLLVDALIRGLADLDPDEAGRCQSVSAAVVYEGVPAVEGLTRR